MLRWYQARVAQSPLLTQSITTAILFATGDVMAQQGVEQVGLDKHNLARTGRMAAYGGVIFGPAATKWYQLLQRNINLRSQNTTIFARVMADQCVFAPVNLGLFLSSMAYLEGASVQQRLSDAYTPALAKNWMVWPWVQGANFKFVPLDSRVLVVNVVSLGWNCYLSYVNSAGGKKVD